MALRVGETTVQTSAQPTEQAVIKIAEKTKEQTSPTSEQVSAQACEAIGDGLLESMFNPNCGLDIYETCDENTWVKCKLASSRLGFYIFAVILVIVMLIIFFVTDTIGKVIVVLVGVGLFLLARYGSSTWIEKTARVEYQRIEKELEGMMRRGNLSRRDAMMQLRDEKLRREQSAAIRGPQGRTAETGLTAGLTAGLVSGLLNRGKK